MQNVDTVGIKGSAGQQFISLRKIVHINGQGQMFISDQALNPVIELEIIGERLGEDHPFFVYELPMWPGET